MKRARPMRELSIVIPFYRNLPMLALHLENLSSVEIPVMRQLTIFLIDDCSPADERPDVMLRNANDEVRSRIRLLRVLDDIPWNQHGARNLGAKLCKTHWLLVTDIDRIVPAHDLRILVTRKLDDSKHYKPLQYRMRPLLPLAELSARAPYDQFLCTRRAYWKAGGYDEDYCGSYGGDGPFLKELEKRAPLERLADVRMFRYNRHVLDGANTATLDRDAGAKLYRSRYRDKHSRGDITPRNPIRFRWNEVKL